MAKIDYSHEVKISRFPLVRAGLIIAASTSVAVGVIGIFLPILPTTPFLLLGAVLYSRSSVRFYNGLMNNRYFGPPLRLWKLHGAIRRATKIWAISFLAFSLTPTILLWVPVVPVQLLLAGIGLSVAVFIATRPEV